eukprot:CAMPEP_0205798960 /NCGR_PEP_ID=MMETSP0205-20121125/65_1 /ASSEMBLY_ACC=CAM_ASM_000278 /TAXON_ID=36767 /ORGANISM="Euplotes focardii, Strain TN1" /LENGTH=368 /DNA_ID=CAMNT_0053059463 /DNA_START=150 /DNA_END=1256 /DNA_ORIENTATION=-
MKDGEDLVHNYQRNVDGDIYDVNFDFCESLPERLVCNGVDSLASEAKENSEFADNCRPLTSQKGSNQIINLESGDNIDEHLMLSYESETVCEEGFFGIGFEIFCDKDITDEPQFGLNNAKSTSCKPVYSTTHKAGCYTGDLNALWRFIESNNIVFGIIAMVLGAYNMILGRKFIRPTIGLIFCLTTVSIVLFIFYVLFLPHDVEKWVGWLLLSISVVLGSIAGFFASKLVRVGVFFIGLWSGIGLGLLLNNLIFYKINHVAVVWVLMAVLGLSLGVLSFFWYNYIVIICTSILGSYLFVRGLAFIAGGYPNEFTIYTRIRNGEVNSVPGTFYAYMAGMLVAFAIAFFIQFTIKKREGKKDDMDVYKRV